MCQHRKTRRISQYPGLALSVSTKDFGLKVETQGIQIFSFCAKHQPGDQDDQQQARWNKGQMDKATTNKGNGYHIAPKIRRDKFG